MSKRYLGDTIDIHAGGEDLIFPHHENEIAQSEASNGVTFSKYWMHNAFLNIDNHKMSKSAGNFFTVREITEKYDPQVLRFLMLSAHYRSPLNFSDELMASAKNGYERIVNCVSSLDYLIGKASDGDMSDDESGKIKEADKFRAQFEEKMDDDFNTADAITAIFDLVKYTNLNTDDSSSKKYLETIKKEIVTLSDVLGLIVEKQEESVDADIDKLIEDRQAARKNKDFAKADQIRDDLLKQGIILEDTKEGVKWKRA